MRTAVKGALENFSDSLPETEVCVHNPILEMVGYALP